MCRALLPLLLLSGCFVDPVCHRDADCPGAQICAAGACTDECAADDDCAAGFVCEGRRCAADLACAGCEFPHAAATCLRGDCRMGACDPGYLDLDQAPENGCEYRCTPRGAERCDGVDDDCDGLVDEGFDLYSDAAHCGACGHVCPAADHATPRCEAAICRLRCDAGWFDNDGDASNGCEASSCVPSNGGVEACDDRDNDCDGEVDEGFPKHRDHSCGTFCADCTAAFPHAAGRCVVPEPPGDATDGRCAMADCDPGHVDLDSTPTNGCEYACLAVGPEVCNAADDDCDGEVDEGLVCCPEDMVSVSDLFCMDRYEASRTDATAASPGVDDQGPARSVAGVLPWRVGPDNDAAAAACARADKRLCTAAEWELACRGPGDHAYVYGDTYQPLTCNGIDAYCRADPPYAGCGLEDYSFRLEPTGTRAGCTNAHDTRDLNGNLWEHVAGGDATTVRGGAYNCSDSRALHRCDSIPRSWTPAALGFRCCADGRGGTP